MKQIVRTPDEVLITPAREVGKIDKKILGIIKDMKDALIVQDNPKGVGLAAPQIGVGLRIFLMRPQEKDPIATFINPLFLEKSTEMIKGIPGSEKHIEGCLSIPNVWGPVTRHKSVTISFIDEFGKPQTRELKGFKAVIAQHEMDHLEGILFTRRVIEQKGTLYEPKIDKNGKEVLEPLEI